MGHAPRQQRREREKVHCNNVTVSGTRSLAAGPAESRHLVISPSQHLNNLAQKHNKRPSARSYDLCNEIRNRFYFQIIFGSLLFSPPQPLGNVNRGKMKVSNDGKVEYIFLDVRFVTSGECAVGAQPGAPTAYRHRHGVPPSFR